MNTTQERPGWADQLLTPLPDGRDSDITITLNPRHTRPAITVLATRLRGLVAALGPVQEPGEPDPLADADTADLGALLDVLHQVTDCLRGQEERVLTLAAESGMSLRSLAVILGVNSPETVRYRLERIREAGEQGMTAAAPDAERG